ncbi:CBS domain-containing protein [Caulobacter sp. 17J80-11]|uniref:CBS domain-containing protein n=1 Tax=Caulobacter sp. 17J80-11 TaxID=2763502 RepID=UPI001653752A|nr:CBS domain-containing protein [Caulobacter sp. 17J80-11]MBC6980969.1 CBS domain-containing protein [Caulobacter sp. 17J80-11]
MKVRDLMTRDVEVARPEEPIQSVAQRMARGDFGFMPVVDGKRLIGAVTDRDLAIRAVAGALPPSTPVGEVMTRDVSFLNENDDLETVLNKMSGEQIRRLPIVNDARDLCGVVSIGDMAAKVKERYAGEALEAISKPAAGHA